MTNSASKPNSAPGILICGAYGMGNAGDEAILDAIVGEMRELSPDARITVMSRDPGEASARLGVHAIHTLDVPAFLRACRSSALYINGGGSLIQDVTSRRSLWYYLFTLRAAKRRGCRVMMYGCGIGPVLYPRDAARTRRTLNGFVDAITLREPDSLEELRRFGVTAPEMTLASDPALRLSPASDAEVDALLRESGADPGGRYVCFALRRWPGFNEKAEAFARTARALYTERGLTPLFLSVNHRNDGDAAERVRALLGGTPCCSLPGPLPAPLAIGVMGRMSLVISMRLHGLVFAASRGVPLVGVSYDPKVSSFLRCVGAESVELSDLTGDGLCALARRAAERDPQELADSVRRLKALEMRNTEAAARLLGKDR